MEKLCSDIVQNIECWMCGYSLNKIKGDSYYIIKCTNDKCDAHVIIVTKEELEKLESD